MTDILRFLFIVILLTVALAAYFLAFGALFPNRVAKTQRIIVQMPGRSFGVGLVNFLFFGVILMSLLILTNENRVSDILRVILYVPTFILSAMLAVILSLGLTGMVNILGERIFPELNTIRRSILGSVVLSLACALPFVGWFLLLPYTGLTGFGAVILGFFQKGE
jgi:sorbitol-specific phosphotransferase system component IIBC